MIVFESVGKSVLEVVSGNYFHKRWMEVGFRFQNERLAEEVS